jgi:acylphosphatase
MRAALGRAAMVVKRYRVTGRVQGVGFRYFVFRRADEIGVSGWVRNMADGSVEAVVSGSESQHREVAAALAEGPRWSKVRNLEVTGADEIDLDRGFQISRDGR